MRERKHIGEYAVDTSDPSGACADLIARGLPATVARQCVMRLAGAEHLRRLAIARVYLPDTDTDGCAAWLRLYGYLPAAVPVTPCARAECGQPLDIRRGVAGNPVTGKLYHPACHPMSRARGAS